jgi:hypothetical protein
VDLAKHLDKRNIQGIVNLIHGWTDEKLTWPAICEAVEPLVGKIPTRQSLNAHEEIKSAYLAKKKGLKSSGPKKPQPASLKAAAERIANLESKLDEVKDENNMLKERFVVWQYNAYKHGMKEYQLNAPLPKIDRERSDGTKR